MGRGPRGLRGHNNIFMAAWHGSLGAVRHLLRTVPGAAAATDEYGTTALHYAALQGRAELCRALLAAGAAVDARNRHGLLAKDCAAGVIGKSPGSRSPEVLPRCIMRRSTATWRW